MNNEWDEKLGFLLATRKGWCNSDYIEFLVQKVWRIRDKVDLVDFGCGFGYMGLLLMPLLPQGSTYTGIDNSEVLLREAKRMFAERPYTAKFIKADLTEYIPEEHYDMATSQAVLRHIPNPRSILGKMVRSVRTNGLVICMETDRPVQDAGLYLSNLDIAELRQTELYRKIWKRELESGGRDYRTGVKIPQYMQELGLRDIGVRINDRAEFINPRGQTYDEDFKNFVISQGWNRAFDETEKQGLIRAMRKKGLTREEAERFVHNETAIQESVDKGCGTEYILKMSGTPIAYGWK